MIWVWISVATLLMIGLGVCLYFILNVPPATTSIPTSTFSLEFFADSSRDTLLRINKDTLPSLSTFRLQVVVHSLAEVKGKKVEFRWYERDASQYNVLTPSESPVINSLKTPFTLQLGTIYHNSRLEVRLNGESQSVYPAIFRPSFKATLSPLSTTDIVAGAKSDANHAVYILVSPALGSSVPFDGLQFNIYLATVPDTSSRSFTRQDLSTAVLLSPETITLRKTSDGALLIKWDFLSTELKDFIGYYYLLVETINLKTQIPEQFIHEWFWQSAKPIIIRNVEEKEGDPRLNDVQVHFAQGIVNVVLTFWGKESGTPVDLQKDITFYLVDESGNYGFDSWTKYSEPKGDDDPADNIQSYRYQWLVQAYPEKDTSLTFVAQHRLGSTTISRSREFVLPAQHISVYLRATVLNWNVPVEYTLLGSETSYLSEQGEATFSLPVKYGTLWDSITITPTDSSAGYAAHVDSTLFSHGADAIVFKFTPSVNMSVQGTHLLYYTITLAQVVNGESISVSNQITLRMNGSSDTTPTHYSTPVVWNTSDNPIILNDVNLPATIHVAVPYTGDDPTLPDATAWTLVDYTSLYQSGKVPISDPLSSWVTSSALVTKDSTKYVRTVVTIPLVTDFRYSGLYLHVRFTSNAITLLGPRFTLTRATVYTPMVVHSQSITTTPSGVNWNVYVTYPVVDGVIRNTKVDLSAELTLQNFVIQNISGTPTIKVDQITSSPDSGNSAVGTLTIPVLMDSQTGSVTFIVQPYNGGSPSIAPVNHSFVFNFASSLVTITSVEWGPAETITGKANSDSTRRSPGETYPVFVNWSTTDSAGAVESVWNANVSDSIQLYIGEDLTSVTSARVAHTTGQETFHVTIPSINFDTYQRTRFTFGDQSSSIVYIHWDATSFGLNGASELSLNHIVDFDIVFKLENAMGFWSTAELKLEIEGLRTMSQPTGYTVVASGDDLLVTFRLTDTNVRKLASYGIGSRRFNLRGRPSSSEVYDYVLSNHITTVDNLPYPNQINDQLVLALSYPDTINNAYIDTDYYFRWLSQGVTTLATPFKPHPKLFYDVYQTEMANRSFKLLDKTGKYELYYNGSFGIRSVTALGFDCLFSWDVTTTSVDGKSIPYIQLYLVGNHGKKRTNLITTGTQSPTHPMICDQMALMMGWVLSGTVSDSTYFADPENDAYLRDYITRVE